MTKTVQKLNNQTTSKRPGVQIKADDNTTKEEAKKLVWQKTNDRLKHNNFLIFWGMIKKILLILGHKTLMTDAYGIKKRNKKTYQIKEALAQILAI